MTNIKKISYTYARWCLGKMWKRNLHCGPDKDFSRHVTDRSDESKLLIGT